MKFYPSGNFCILGSEPGRLMPVPRRLVSYYLLIFNKMHYRESWKLLTGNEPNVPRWKPTKENVNGH